MKRRLLVGFAAAACCAALLLLAILAGGVWLPDVFSDARRTLAFQDLPSGYRFQVLQYWNHFDFYYTELHVQAPDGRVETYTLDGDDVKHWWVLLRVDEAGRTAVVALDRGRERAVRW